MVLQNYALYPHMTAFDNLAYGLHHSGRASEVRVRVAARVPCCGSPKRWIGVAMAMSGGQRQRVAIGPAIVLTPEAFLFDEPLSNLDAALRVETRGQIAKRLQSLAPP